MNGEASGCQTQAQPRPQRRDRRLRTRDQSHGVRVQATQRDSGAGRGGRGAQPRAQRLPGAQSSSLALSSPEPSARRLPESHVCTCGERPARGLSVLAPWDSAGPRGLQRLPGPCPCPLRAELSFKSLPTSSPRPHPRWAGRLQESRLGTPETD